MWIFSFLFGASPKTCVALKSIGFLLQAAFPFKASLHTKQNAQFNFCGKFPPTNLPLQHPTFSPVSFLVQKKGMFKHTCSSFFWGEVARKVCSCSWCWANCKFSLAPSSGSVIWGRVGGGELPQKKQKTSEFETHLFRLLTVNFRHGMGYYTWILRVLLGIFVVSVSYVAKRTSLQQKGIHSWWVYQPTVLGCFPSPIRNQQLQQNGHVQPLSWVMCKLR